MKRNISSIPTLVLAMILGTTAVSASAKTNGFKVAVVKDAIASESLISGDYDASLDTLTNTDSLKKFENLTSLCVAHIKTHKLSAAEDSCSKAVNSIEAKATRGRTYKHLKAIAYSNRGIARYLSNDTLAAHEDFLMAGELSNDAIITGNMNYFKSSYAGVAPLASEPLTAE